MISKIDLEKEDRVALIFAYTLFGIFSLAIPFLQSYMFFGMVFFLTFGLILWKIRFCRNYCYGKVLLSSKNLAGVIVDYDIRSNVRSGRYVVDSQKEIKTGKKVRVLVRKGTPHEILDVVK